MLILIFQGENIHELPAILIAYGSLKSKVTELFLNYFPFDRVEKSWLVHNMW